MQANSGINAKTPQNSKPTEESTFAHKQMIKQLRCNPSSCEGNDANRVEDRRSLLVGKRVEREQQHGNVMVPMQKYEWCLPDYDEEGVEKLEDLGGCEERHPEDDRAAPVVILTRHADVLEERVLRQAIEQVRHYAESTNNREDST